MKAIVVRDEAAGTAGMTLVERPEPEPAINDVVVQAHASGFTPGELTWPSTWTDRLGRDRTPSIPGHELAGVVSALGYGTTGLSVGQRVFGLTDWTRDGTLAEYVHAAGAAGVRCVDGGASAVAADARAVPMAVVGALVAAAWIAAETLVMDPVAGGEHRVARVGEASAVGR
jgi:NADPH:quinone reductase-like Zn-dependent oxidoreductase